MMRRLVAFTATLLSTDVLGAQQSKEKFDERLTVWPMLNGYNLLDFEFTFEVDFSNVSQASPFTTLDKFPRQVYDLMRSLEGDVRRIETNQVQGRWQQALMPKVFSYQESEMQVSHELRSGDGQEVFQPKEHGFSIKTDTIDELLPSDMTKIYGQIGTLQSVAIVETRHDSVEIQGVSQPEQFFTSDDLQRRRTTYYAKPFESFCHENLSFLLKHLKETTYESGVRTLYSSETMHNTFYKQASWIIEKVYPREGGTTLRLSCRFTYVAQTGTEGLNLQQLLVAPKSKLVHCLNCDESSIRLQQSQGATETLYSLSKLSSQGSSISLEEVWAQKSKPMQGLSPTRRPLSSERYLSDLQFAKDATFYHILKNNHPNQALELYTQDYFRDSMRPFLHQLTIRVRFFGDDSPVAKFIGRDNYKVRQDYIRFDQQSEESIVTISDLVIPPQAELIITFGVKKSMMQFEQYPNDPQRGFNVQHMPILFREFTKADNADEVRKELPWKSIESPYMLVQIPEPDYSMVFNVNGVTFAVFGVFTVNMYNSLVKPKRFPR